MDETPSSTPELCAVLVEEANRLEQSDPEEAEALYQRALSLDPGHFPALYLCGNLMERLGQHEASADLLERAVMVNPRSAGAHASLGRALWGLGRPEEALSHLGRALMSKPDDVDAMLNRAIVLRDLDRHEEALASLDRALALQPGLESVLLNRANTLMKLQRPLEALADYDKLLALRPGLGDEAYNDGLACLQLDRPEEALEFCERLLATRPGHVLAWSLRCSALLTLERYEEGVECADRVLALCPSQPEALLNRSTALLKLERPGEALDCCEISLAIRPGDADAWLNRASALVGLQRFGEALESADQSLALRPGHRGALLNRVCALLNLRQPVAALECCDGILALHPSHAEAWINRAVALLALRRSGEALESADRALEISPNNPDATLNRGIALLDLKQPSNALVCCEEVLATQPGHVLAWNNRGTALHALGRHQEAIASFDRALAIQPERAEVHSNKIFVLDFLPDLTFEQHQEERRAYGRIQAQGIQAQTGHANDRDPERRLVLGYVSSDFRHHSAVFCFGPVLSHHDRDRFKVICYSGVLAEDDWTEKLRQLSDPWRDVAGLSDEALAEQIRADEVDILIDLSGHSKGNRLPVFVRKPAPIQVTAWGYCGGTGLPAVDYQFTDPVYIPERFRPLFAETLVDLPCCITFQAQDDVPETGDLPARSKGFVTFGCLNRFSKVSPAALDLWFGILADVPGSRLLLKDGALEDPEVRRRTLEAGALRSIGPERFDLRGATTKRDHMAAYNEVDIVLDSFPHNGGITTWEALWMGAPVVALEGRNPGSRVSSAILHALGLADWVAEQEADYAALAVRWAKDMDGLARLRSGMRERILASDAGNPERYTRIVEATYRDMWRRWVRQQSVP